MSYLQKYGNKGRKFQEGGMMAPEGEAPMAAGPAEGAPAEGGGQEEQILALAQATVAGDPQAAAELGQLVAPMILQEMEAAGGGGAPQGPPVEEAAPVFRRGGKFVGTTY